MKRWIWILAMAPVMFGLFQLVVWADCLYQWKYSPLTYAPPTAVDYARAAIVFWGALLTPVCVGLVAAVVAFRKQYTARWPIGEMCIAAIPLLLFCGSIWFHHYDNSAVKILMLILMYSNFIVGGVIVMLLLNLGACIRHRKWGKLTLSALVFCAGMFYLLWLYAFIIYIDT